MEKDKVLEKSRRENKDQDEMERTIRIEGESFSLARSEERRVGKECAA